MISTDFHTHILPNVDDGSESVEQSLEMLRLSAAQGITRVVATPHFYPQHDSPDRFLQRREQAFSALREAMSGEAGLPEVVLGAEVYFFPGISECTDIQGLTLGESRHIMVEMPMTRWTESMYRELEQLYTHQNLVPVIAHLDRYLHPFTWRKTVRSLAQLPVRIQVNSEFFLNRSTAAIAMSLLCRDWVHALGSDCHNLTDRKPDLGQAAERIREKLGQQALNRLAEYAREIL